MPKPPRLRGTQRYLAAGERILLTTRRHPVLLVKPVAKWIASLLAVGLISFVLTEGRPIPILDTIVLWLALAMTAYTAYKALDWWRTFYVVTDERVLLMRGVFSVNVSAVRLARVTETSFNRTLWGRLLGYGELKLDTPGEQLTLATLAYLPRAAEVYRLVTSLLLGEDEEELEPYDPGEEVTGPLPPVVR
ncbi:MAG TPA: PH domain-containing protein [Actinomycetota bacterium]|nr:PH domain-containing protein [Actinomycetota bacterium]